MILFLHAAAPLLFLIVWFDMVASFTLLAHASVCVKMRVDAFPVNFFGIRRSTSGDRKIVR